ncbi:MAG TPA: FAD-dependent oxidoreductase [Pyrinomonadaceae bacterium]|nr:FAD-dependent oxidoreductase [Pyrinomonadaceae bacterium]
MSVMTNAAPAERVPAAAGDSPAAQRTTCCVVGGGPAGAVLALLLARRGVAVTLLELHGDFDRDFRGDTLHPSVLEIMDGLGLADRLLELPHSKIRTLNMMGAGGRGVTLDFGALKTKYPYIAALPQARFLEFITGEAGRHPHFRLVMNANVRELIEEGGAVRGVRYEDKAGRTHELRALLTVGADGRSSRVRRLSGMEPVKTSPPMDVLWFRLPRRESDGAGVGGRFGRGRILVQLDRGEEWQVGYVIPKGSYQRLRAAGLNELRRGVAELGPELSDRVGHLKDWKQVSLLSVESSLLEQWYRPGLLLIGDAAHVMSPVAGVGINYAIQDAVVAANVLAGPLLAGEVRPSALRAVQRRRRLPTRIIQAFQSMIQRRLISQALDAERPVTPPAFLRFAPLRRLAARFIAFGVWPARVKG